MDRLEPPYIERPPLEQTCYDAIVEPGGLIRIKAPQKMGKTLLLGKVLGYAREQGYCTVKIDFSIWDNSILQDYDRFFRSFCYRISQQLKLDNIDNQIDTEWKHKENLGSTGCCEEYFTKYILSENNKDLVLGLDKFEVLFQHQQIFRDFCCLLRSWHEGANPEKEPQGNQVNKWRKLRLVIVNSTEKYPELDINHSPFNVGINIDEKVGLKGFDLPQVKLLLNGYQLNQKVGEKDLQKLLELVDGHPFLIKESFSYLQINSQISINDLLEKATTDEGIFINYLREISGILDNNEQLKQAYNQVIKENRVILDSKLSFQLQSLGLIKFDGNYSVSSCDLYLQYFLIHNFIQEINQILKKLSDAHSNISESEARSLVQQELNQKIAQIETQQPQNWQILKQQLLDPERWLRSGKKALVAVADYYISNSVIYKAGLAFLEEFSTN